jgi:hypothetical protein
MAFAVICKSCQARFLLNDDLLRRKVAGRVVTVRCRQCHAPIEVDASNVDPKTLPQVQEAAPEPPPAPPEPPPAPLKQKAPRPAPSPPRPTAKSTLMGIGGPPRPQGATEMVALSPGLLNMAASAPAPRGFPEPPPPPAAAASVVEELDGDWEVTETPIMAQAEAAPESLDDFAEELPPSLPHPEEELPSSTGTPSLNALTHHDVVAPTRPKADDFLANMSAAMNGGIMGGSALGAPTIDVSTLAAAPTAASASNEVDLSAFDIPLSGKQTLPLFSLADDEAKTPTPGIVGRATKAGTAPQRPSAPRPAESAAGRVESSPASDRDAPRERRNVVPPSTKSVPPPAPTNAQRRSGLAAPLLLAVAAAAGFLIWKRTASPPAATTSAEKPTAVAVPTAPAQLPATVQPPSELVAPAPTAAAEPAAPADDLTFETVPNKPAPGLAKPAAATSEAATPRPATPSEPKPATSEPATPSAPVVKDEPKPTPATPSTPTEPAGPFDRAAAAAALTAGAAQASACRKEGDPSGVASVVITFAPSGRVTSATIGGPPFAGTPTGSCIAAALRKARVPPFEGDRVTVSKTIVVQ